MQLRWPEPVLFYSTKSSYSESVLQNTHGLVTSQSVNLKILVAYSIQQILLCQLHSTNWSWSWKHWLFLCLWKQITFSPLDLKEVIQPRENLMTI